MKLLAFDLSTRRGTIALANEEGILSATDWPNDRRTSAPFFAALEEIIRKHGAPETIVVGLGPGSYTGTRIAISAAIGLAATTGAALAGISSLCAISDEEEIPPEAAVTAGQPPAAGLEETLLGLGLAERISYDAERNTLYGVNLPDQEIEIYPLSNGTWSAASPYVLPNLTDIALTPNGRSLIVLTKQCAQFVLKAHLPVMPFLMCNVAPYPVQIGLAHRKVGIAALPLEIPVADPLLFQPQVRDTFQFLYPFRLRDCAAETCEYVHVVFHSPDEDGWAIERLGDTAQVRMQSFARDAVC